MARRRMIAERSAQDARMPERSFAAARAESDRTFALLEARLARIEAILLEQTRILLELPDAICEKIVPMCVANGLVMTSHSDGSTRCQ